MKITVEEAIEHLKEGGEVTVEAEGYSYEISQSENWVGGDAEEGYISSVLGNVIYDDARYVIEKTIKWLSSDGAEVVLSV